VLIPNGLQPAQVEEVFLYQRLGRAIVLVKEDQLSLAIGRRGQNVRLASKLVGWDIEIMTHDELNEGIERAEGWFRQIPGVADELVEVFIEEGFLSYDDLTFLEPAQLAELAGVTEEQADAMIVFAEESAERVEEETRVRRAAEAEARAAMTPEEQAAADAEAAAAREPAASREPAKPTLESLFGPDVTVKPEKETLSAAQVFGDAPAPAPSGEDAAEPAPGNDRE
jgi:N utilization substance protein A